MAHSGGSSALSIAWSKGRPGQMNQQYEIAGSAYGGGAGHDGATGPATHLSNLHVTPIEVLESEFPCRITRFGLVPDSGGPAAGAAGSRMQREYELLEDAVVIRRFNKTRFPPQGRGRRQGRRACALRGARRHRQGVRDARRRRGSRCWPASASCCKARAAAATAIRGSATARRSQRDIAEGYVSKDAAVNDYGSNE